MPTYTLTDDGRWVPAVPVKPHGIARLEFFLRRKGFTWLPNILADFDERNLGR